MALLAVLSDALSRRPVLAGAAGGPSAEYESERRKADAMGGLALLLVVAAIFLMVAKPGA